MFVVLRLKDGRSIEAANATLYGHVLVIATVTDSHNKECLRPVYSNVRLRRGVSIISRLSVAI